MTPPKRERRQAGDQAALGIFTNHSNAVVFNPDIAHPQEADLDQLADLRFRRNVERLHTLGPRVFYEFLAEIGARHLIRTTIEQAVERHADIGLLKALGGHRFPTPAIWLVGGDQ